MEQTPAHEIHNPDLLGLIPRNASSVIEVGCSSGALAREYKKVNPGCRYVGIELVPEYAELARRHCDEVIVSDIEVLDAAFFERTPAYQCWIFGDSLEHLRDPWLLLSKIRAAVPKEGCVVACIPNAQHWSVQVRLSCGEFRYEESGLLDRTHLRWFTRMTIIEMFHAARFTIAEGLPRVFDEPNREKVLPAIRALAASIGADADMAVNDALPLQYVVRAVPA